MNTKNAIRFVLGAIGIGFGWTAIAALFYLYIIATGPTKVACIAANTYGEYNIEVMMLLAALAILPYIYLGYLHWLFERARKR